MPARSIFPDAHVEYIRRLYLLQSLQPATITPMVNEKFGSRYTHIQIQRFVNVRWSKLRKKRDEKAKALLAATDRQVAAKGIAKLMDRFAEKSARATDKALDMTLGATDARTMASAAGAAKSLLTMTRLCLGIEGSDTNPGATKFNFNFFAYQPKRVGEPADVEVSATEQPDADELDEDDPEAESLAAEGEPSETKV